MSVGVISGVSYPRKEGIKGCPVAVHCIGLRDCFASPSASRQLEMTDGP
jgi:hypothetical protein